MRIHQQRHLCGFCGSTSTTHLFILNIIVPRWAAEIAVRIRRWIYEFWRFAHGY